MVSVVPFKTYFRVLNVYLLALFCFCSLPHTIIHQYLQIFFFFFPPNRYNLVVISFFFPFGLQAGKEKNQMIPEQILNARNRATVCSLPAITPLCEQRESTYLVTSCCSLETLGTQNITPKKSKGSLANLSSCFFRGFSSSTQRSCWLLLRNQRPKQCVQIKKQNSVSLSFSARPHT